MAVNAVVFDVGETLVDETEMWSELADTAGVPRFTLFGVIGGLAARGEHWARAFDLLGVERPTGTPFSPASLYPDAPGCIERLRADGYIVGLAGNASDSGYSLLGLEVDFVGNSGSWGVEKPLPAFFARIVAACGCPAEEIAYVGDRVDNDIAPALAAGMVAVHIRRGPWGHLHEPPAEALRIRSLEELPEALGV